MEVRWNKSPHEWLKINSDGAMPTDSRPAGAGGVASDATGKWIFGYSREIGRCNTVQAELWGIFDGLSIAWGWNFKKVIIECDSSHVVNWINKGTSSDSSDALFDAILEICNRPWTVQIRHIFREANQVADAIAKSPSSTVKGLRIFMEPPSIISPLLELDAARRTYKRLMPSNVP